jgi:two-component system sensor histidine kinase YesM
MIRLTLIIIIVMIFGVTVLITFGISYYQSNVEELSFRLIQNNMRQISARVENIYLDMMRLSNVISTDETVLSTIWQNNPDVFNNSFTVKHFDRYTMDDFYHYARLQNKLKYFRSNFLFNYDSHITMLTPDGIACSVVTNMQIPPEGDFLSGYYQSVPQESLINSILSEQDVMQWIIPFSYDTNTGPLRGKKFLTLATKIKNNYTLDIIGILLIHVNLENLDIVFRDGFLTDSYLFNERNQLVYSHHINNPQWFEGFLYSDFLQQIPPDIIVHRYKFEHFGLKMISLIQSYDDLVEQIHDIKIRYILLSVITTIITIIIILLLLAHQMGPFKNLVKHIRSGAYGAFYVDESIQVDDVQSIVNGFENMLTRNNILNENILQEQKLKYQMQYDMFRAQITPHFLFNTLNIIKWKALLKGDTEVSGMLADLGVLLDASISRDTEYITIKEEINLLHKYMNIQNVRFDQAFSFQVDCDPGLEQYKIIKLLLQPIVENAIIHGFESRPKNARIMVKVQLTDAGILISVEDNGTGMGEERILMALKNPEDSGNTFSGIGLANINQRIKYHYGPQYGISIFSSASSGTRVELLIAKE